LVVSLALPVGCRSAFIEATVLNQTGQPVSVVQVDYPSASFGTQSIAPGGSFHYRFKVIGSGATDISYTDAAHKDHHSTGPVLEETDRGTLRIVVSDGGVQWAFHRPGAH
jgi:hypothetical protein